MTSTYPIEQMPGVELHAIFFRVLLRQEEYQPHNPLAAKPIYRTENRDGLAGQNLHRSRFGVAFRLLAYTRRTFVGRRLSSRSRPTSRKTVLKSRNRRSFLECGEVHKNIAAARLAMYQWVTAIAETLPWS